MAPDHLLLIGASTRAAAFSALRAGLSPWCVDLFADRDLQLACPALRLQGKYPQAFLEAMDAAPPGPWMYTGGMENYPGIVDRMAEKRTLWGTDLQGLVRSRDPFFVHSILSASGLPVPAVQDWLEDVPDPRRWLRKPVQGAGGIGIRFCDDGVTGSRSRPYYFQEFVEGLPAAALFVGDGWRAECLGMSCQLVGTPWLHARPFQYCGSIGPLVIDGALGELLDRLGDVLTVHCQLRGVFGADGILRDGVFWPVEINPRYTASVEVLEHARGIPVLQMHAQAGTGAPPCGGRLNNLFSRPPQGGAKASNLAQAQEIIGKAILFARQELRFPAEGPWMETLAPPVHLGLPAFADIPEAGEVIPAGRPVLSFFTRGESLEACEEQLRQISADLDRRLFGA
jgi:predicted ATP-grasp superfamily ATP-dependent carboligase